MTPAVLAEVARRYGVAASDLAALDGFESFIFDTTIRDGRAIIRVGHSRRRSEGLVRSELDWLAFLSDRGLGVTAPIGSQAARLVESIDDGHGEQFVAAAFGYAPGRPPDTGDWAPPLWERYGRLLGGLHEAAVEYIPTAGIEPRPHWDDDAMLDVFSFLPRNEPAARTSLRRVLDHVAELPRAGDDYALIHQDAHAGNFFVADDGSITLFDFDDCCYSWFVNDLAIALFYALSWAGFRGDDPAVGDFWRHFLRGYETVRTLDRQWLEEVPWFLKLRELDTYAVIHRSMDVTNIDDPWARRFMAGRRERVNAGVPVVDRTLLHR